MRNVGLVGATLTAVAIAAAACNGGGGGGGLAPADGRISSGRYRITTSQIVQDECALTGGATNIDGATYNFTVNVTAETIEQDGGTPIAGTYKNGVITIEDSSTFDWSTDPLGIGAFDCLEEDLYLLEGRTPTNTTITDGTILITWRAQSGAECDDAYVAYSQATGDTVSLPCETEASYEMEFYPPQTGTLTTAGGMAPLTFDGSSTGTNGHYTYSLGTGTEAQTGVEFFCFMPDPPSFPNYDLFVGDITMSLTTAAWSVGSHAIDGASVTLSVSGVLGDADATGGSINLLTAPMTTTGTCSFSISNVPIAEPAALARPATNRRPLLGQK